MLKQFRNRYPQGSLISELVSVEQGKYVVRVLVQVDGVTLVTALAAHDLIEEAEDKARIRALSVLDIEESTPSEAPVIVNIIKENSAAIVSQETEAFQKIAPSTPPVNSQAINLPTSSQEKPPEKIMPAPLTSNSEEITISVEATPSEEAIITPVAVTPPSEAIITPVAVIPPSEAIITPVAVTPPSEAIITTVAVTPPSEAIITPVAVTPPEEIATKKEVTPEITPSPSIASPPLNFRDISAQTDIEMKRLGWTKEQGKDYLVKTYGKKSRQLLSDEDLKEFLEYLQQCP